MTDTKYGKIKAQMGGSASEVANYVGHNKQLIIDEDNRRIHIMDGITKGGKVIPNKDDLENMEESINSYQLSSEATKRNFKDKLNDRISVKDFGAIGDGITDDTQAIQNAVDYLGNLGGGTLYIPKGTYIIEYINIMFDNIHILGEGWGSSILKAKQAKCLVGNNSYGVLQYNYPITDYTGPSSIIPLNNCSVRNLGIDGSMSEEYADECEALIEEDNVDTVTARGHAGINSFRMTNFYIDNVYIYDCYNYGIGNVGGDMENRDNVRISNCIIKRTARDGIDSKKGIKNFFIENCDISYSGYITENRLGKLTDQVGIDLRCINGVFSNNRVQNTISAGIRVRADIPASGETQKIIIENNFLSNCGNAGLQIASKEIPTYIINNYCEGSNWSAVIANEGIITIDGLYCDSAIKGGIWISSASQEEIRPNVILKRIFSSNNPQAIACSSANSFTIEDSIFNNITSTAISVNNTKIVSIVNSIFNGNGETPSESSRAISLVANVESLHFLNNLFNNLNTDYLGNATKITKYNNKYNNVTSVKNIGIIFNNVGSIHDDYLTLPSDYRISFGGTLSNPSIYPINDTDGLRVANFWLNSTFLSPNPDNEVSCGVPSRRWSHIYAGTGTISTSDARTKINITEPSETLIKAWNSVNFKVFQFIDAVKKKGSDKARLHLGAIAQEVKSAFEAQGLNAFDYGLLCYDEWKDKYEDIEIVDKEEVLDEEGNVTTPRQSHIEKKKVLEAGNRYGLRYEECLILEAICQRARADKLENKLNETINTLNSFITEYKSNNSTSIEPIEVIESLQTTETKPLESSLATIGI